MSEQKTDLDIALEKALPEDADLTRLTMEELTSGGSLLWNISRHRVHDEILRRAVERFNQVMDVVEAAFKPQIVPEPKTWGVSKDMAAEFEAGVNVLKEGAKRHG